MTTSKKILLRIPEELLQEIDTLAALEKVTRTQLVRDAISFYLQDKRTKQIETQLITGYQEMAQINLQYANQYVFTDTEGLDMYEKMLKEMN